jgi:metal-sulfur cluster biosynthetic enzyme
LDEAGVWRALEDVKDPEFPMSVVDLGLIYGIRLEGGCIRVTMTLTSMGCPCHDWIVEDVRERLARLPGAESVEVEVVWDPPWTRARISPPGRRALARWGVSA